MGCNGKHLLVVDKEPNTRELTAPLLAQRGYSVLGVGDDEAALSAVQQATFFAAILNPREDADLSLVRRLLTADARLPCVLLSGKADAIVNEAVETLAIVAGMAGPVRSAVTERTVDRGVVRVAV